MGISQKNQVINMLKFILILSILFTGCIFDDEDKDDPNYVTYGTATVYFGEGTAQIDLVFEPEHNLYLIFEDEYSHFNGIYTWSEEPISFNSWQGLILRNPQFKATDSATEVDITDMYYMNDK